MYAWDARMELTVARTRSASRWTTAPGHPRRRAGPDRGVFDGHGRDEGARFGAGMGLPNIKKNADVFSSSRKWAGGPASISSSGRTGTGHHERENFHAIHITKESA